MNAGPTELHPPAPLPPDAGWSWAKTFLVILLAFAAHFAFLYLLGSKKPTVPRAVKNVPVFRLADNSSELVRLTDPTLFAVPPADAFAAAFATRAPGVEAPANRFTEAPVFLANDAATLGAAFSAFMQTNRFAAIPPTFKPEPQLLLTLTPIETVLPQNSIWSLAGELARRRRLNTFTAPTLAMNDVIAPSRVQLLVDTDGNVTSVVLLDSSASDTADQTALTLARTLRFTPADKLMFGEILFTWHTVPVAAP